MPEPLDNISGADGRQPVGGTGTNDSRSAKRRRAALLPMNDAPRRSRAVTDWLPGADPARLLAVHLCAFEVRPADAPQLAAGRAQSTAPRGSRQSMIHLECHGQVMPYRQAARLLDVAAKVRSQPVLIELAGHGDRRVSAASVIRALPPNHISNRSLPTLSANANSTADTISVSSLVTSCVPRARSLTLRKSRRHDADLLPAVPGMRRLRVVPSADEVRPWQPPTLRRMPPVA